MDLSFLSLNALNLIMSKEELLQLVLRKRVKRPILFTRIEPWSSTPMYYQISSEALSRAAEQKEKVSPETIFDVLDVHEHSQLPIVSVRDQPHKPAVVVDDANNPVGAWVMYDLKEGVVVKVPSERSAPAPPSRRRTPRPPASPPPPQPPTTGGPVIPPPPVQAPIKASSEGDKRTLFRRTPHIDLSTDRPSPGKTFKAFVYLDKRKPQPSEKIQTVEIEAPDSIKEFPLEVMLIATRHFVVNGDRKKPLTVSRSEEISVAIPFDLLVREDVSDSSDATLTAQFTYLNRPCGRVDRAIELDLQTERQTQSRKRDCEEKVGVALDAFAKPADVLVDVSEACDGDGRHFLVMLSTTLPDFDFRMSEPEPWNFNMGTQSIIDTLMASFTKSGADAFDRQSALKGAGKDLWDKAPQCFKDLFWRLIEEGKPLNSICISSVEPNIPWELMRPYRDVPRAELHDPLGVEFVVGRWVDQRHILPQQHAVISESWVVAPNYTGVNQLKTAQSEAQFVCSKFGGEQVEPATQLGLDNCLGKRPVTLLHFVCHGSTNGGVQRLVLDQKSELTATQIRGMDRLETACRTKAPLVFLNACEVGRTTPALVGSGGLAVAFIRAGARCVIAPLWSVKDDLANQVALDFYKGALAEPTRPFADILSEIRRRSYATVGAEDSYAAYCLYGDPLIALGA